MSEIEILKKKVKSQKYCFFIFLPITIIVCLWKFEYKLACFLIYCVGFILWHNFQISKLKLKNYELTEQINQLKEKKQK